MATSARATRDPATPVLTIRDLLSYRLSRTASLMSRGAALSYRRAFDVSLGEWRALALLAAGVPQSLMQLSRAAALDKAQMSRVITSLTRRGLVLRSSAGGRMVALSLTAEGRKAYSGLIEAASRRDDGFRAALEPEELRVLESALEKLANQARAFIRTETE